MGDVIYPSDALTVYRQENFMCRENCLNFPFSNCLNFPFQVCREISDFALVCRDSKSLGNTDEIILISLFGLQAMEDCVDFSKQYFLW